MMGAVSHETCRVTLQKNKSACILLHLAGLLFNITLSKFYNFYKLFKFHNNIIPIFKIKNEIENFIGGNEI